MRKEEVIAKIGKGRWKEFCKFMFGQTYRIHNGVADFYDIDVENFLRKPKDRFFD